MRVRQGARVVLLDDAQRLLLFKFQDATMVVPSRPLPSDTFWVTVGGGLEAGETFEDAARREVWEETGIREFDLGEWVWVGDAEVNWKAEGFLPSTRCYIGRTSATAVTLAHLAEQERRVHRAQVVVAGRTARHRRNTAPPGPAGLARGHPGRPLDLGRPCPLASSEQVGRLNGRDSRAAARRGRGTRSLVERAELLLDQRHQFAHRLGVEGEPRPRRLEQLR